MVGDKLHDESDATSQEEQSDDDEDEPYDSEEEEEEEEEEDDDDDDDDDESFGSSVRPKSFCLNGQRWSFENPVSLVLAAARQLGMAVQRDARLLWIADEALLDEYDEEAAAALRGEPPSLHGHPISTLDILVTPRCSHSRESTER